MAVLPAFGPGKPVAVRPVGQTGGSKKNWIWYGVGALIGLGVILFLRRGSSSSTQTGQGTLVSTPNASEQGQIDNLTQALTNFMAGPPGPAAPNTMPDPLVVAGSSNTFQHLLDPQAVKNAISNGLTVYYQPSPGAYVPISNTQTLWNGQSWVGQQYGPTYIKANK